MVANLWTGGNMVPRMDGHPWVHPKGPGSLGHWKVAEAPHAEVRLPIIWDAFR